MGLRHHDVMRLLLHGVLGLPLHHGVKGLHLVHDVLGHLRAGLPTFLAEYQGAIQESMVVEGPDIIFMYSRRNEDEEINILFMFLFMFFHIQKLFYVFPYKII
jgi:hypothetical protein